MPLVVTSIQQQLQATSAGILTYPQLGIVKKDGIIYDTFDRSTLNPTNAVAVYTTNGATINTSGARLNLITGTTIGNEASAIFTELHMARKNLFVDGKQALSVDIIFNLNETTDTEGMMVLLGTAAAQTALVTTAIHMGIFWDKSADDNFILTSADGTTQSTTDTGIALTTDIVRLRITWTSTNGATLEFFTGSNVDNVEATHTVTALGITDEQGALIQHFFVQTEAGAAKTLLIQEWSATGE